MFSYEELVEKDTPEWPYPVRYEEEKDVSADVIVIGGGVSGCFAAISAAKKGLKVALVDKGAVKRSGSAGMGIDHWSNVATHPACKLSPEELAQALVANQGGYGNRIATYIQCRESYDALLDLEKMGMKIRDSEDEFKDWDARDEKTKMLFSYDYENKYTARIWGTGMKPALYRECKRLGVEIHERIMATSLLTDRGKRGFRVAGATGVNVRTGEFIVFRGKATILCSGQTSRLWFLSTEFTGMDSGTPPAICCGDGHAMAWKAGAEFTLMEESGPMPWSGMVGFGNHPFGTGTFFGTWHPCTIVDSKGKELPWVNAEGQVVSPDHRTRPIYVPGQKFFLAGGFVQGPGPIITEFSPPRFAMSGRRLFDGLEPVQIPPGFEPPFYADLPSMASHERRAIFGLMVGQEGKTMVVYRNLTQAGFDPDKDMLQMYPAGHGPSGWRLNFLPGMVIDWDLKSNLEGLYVAGLMLYGTGDCSHAATTGRYAGRKAAEYALKAEKPEIDRQQVEGEKQRVYAPVKRKDGLEWKELSYGINRIMQEYCGDVKNGESLKVGLKSFEELREGEASTAYARNPHELVRLLETLNTITVGEAVMYGCLERKASSEWLGFIRLEYPEMDPEEWRKFITIKLVDNEVKAGELPIDYGEPLEKNYQVHCGL